MVRLLQRWRAQIDAAVALLVLLECARASAQTENEVREARVPRTEPVVVAARPPPRSPGDPTSFTSVIQLEEFVGETPSAADLVERAPGVQVRRFGGPGDPTEISIRGISGPRVVVLLDGIRMNSAQSGTVDLSTIPPDLIERIEVTRGGGSVQNGSDAIGGVVNIITKRPSAKPTLATSLAGGSFGTWKTSLSATGRAGENELVFGYDLLHSDNDWFFQTPDRSIDGVPLPGGSRSVPRVNNEVENHAGLLRVGRDLDDHWRIEASDQLFYGSAGRPGPATTGGLLAGQSLTAKQRRTRNIFDLKLDAAEIGRGDAFGGFLRFFHRYDRSRFFDRDPGPAEPTDSDNRNHSIGARGQLTWQPPCESFTPETSLGLEAREDLLRSKDFGNFDRTTVGVFLQQTLGFFDDRVLIAGGARLDWTEGFGAVWIPSIGGELELVAGLRLKGNAERSYRVPNFDELYSDERFIRGNPNLEPEDARNYDIGLRFDYERLLVMSGVWLEVVYFRTNIDNRIVFQLVNSNLLLATNTGPAQSQGVEIGWDSTWLDWLEFSGSYTRIDSNVVRTASPIVGVAQQELTLRFVLRPDSRLWKLVFERQFTDDIPVSEGGGSVVFARTTYDLRAALDLSKIPSFPIPSQGLIVSLVVTNLTDESVRDALFFPQPGRSLTLALEGRW